MAVTLLNRNQARHLTTVLGLLLEDLAELTAALPPEPWADAVRSEIHDAGARVRRLMRRLDLSVPQRTPPRQRRRRRMSPPARGSSRVWVTLSHVPHCWMLR